MASEFRIIDGEIWLGNRCVARLRHYLPYTHESPHFRRDSYWPNFVDK